MTDNGGEPTAPQGRGDGFECSFDASRLDVDAIHAFLTTTYWSPGIPRETLERAIAHSLCIGGYVNGQQVAFARLVTDRATFAYLADVFVLPSHRGQGLSRRLLEALMSHADVQGLRRMLLVTRDAHGLYAKVDFTPLAAPDRFMERHRPNACRGPGAG
ncbi:MAG: GNAT family N-acetyltransferase [Gemmatimonas sp.]|jgi:N-acetylglutamate synthase-like GNAT family acetyltransferase|uniref:GNAT family N-acetyltransferase n=1 Tax=Gemmatimonas sp. TaxID=1962908 RepID=UPI00391F0EBA|nr:GNAT family N-acetyltransferase [Gemmatimonadota bacterium]